MTAKFRPAERDVRGRPQWKAEPMRQPPERTRGLPRRTLKKEEYATAEKAQAWARTRPWYPYVIAECRARPYCVRRIFYWILREEPPCTTS